MSILPDELTSKTFPCPKCRNYISAVAATCSSCGPAITDEIRSEALAREETVKKEITRSRGRNTAVIGFVLFLFGISQFIFPIVSSQKNGTATPCLVLFLISSESEYCSTGCEIIFG